MLPASSGIGGNPFPTQDSGANRRCDCDGYRPDTLASKLRSKEGTMRVQSAVNGKSLERCR